MPKKIIVSITTAVQHRAAVLGLGKSLSFLCIAGEQTEFTIMECSATLRFRMLVLANHHASVFFNLFMFLLAHQNDGCLNTVSFRVSQMMGAEPQPKRGTVW